MSRVVVLHSAATDFDGLEAQDYVIGFLLGFDTDIAGVVAARTRFLEDHAMSDHYHALMAEVLGPELSAEFSCTPPAIPGRSSHLFEAEPTQLDLVAAATLAAYFHYGWIILLRLERAQMELRIADGGNDVLYSSAEIIRQRVRLINIKRRFLTHDRTNMPTLRTLCSEYRKKFKMDTRFESLTLIHEFFEHHLDNTAKVLQAERTKALSKALNILTFLAIPLSVIGTLLAIDLKSSVLTSPDSVLSNSMLWFLIGGTFGMFLGVIVLARLIDLMLIKRRFK